MDKYEYKLKTEEMLELMEDGEYRKAAAAADLIDWKRVRNAGMLMNVSDIYEKTKEYQKSYDVMNLAYRRSEGSRKVIYKLCSLAIKTKNIDEAIDYYDEFIQIAPKDPNRHILRYQILRAQRAPIEQQIEALEEFKKAEYIEEWAYELAKLYREAGMMTECLEECDDLILWFSEGKYVYKAMELKMQYKPLSPSQQQKYDHRYEKLSSETEEIPDLTSYLGEDEEKDSASEGAEALGDTRSIGLTEQPVMENDSTSDVIDTDAVTLEAAEEPDAKVENPEEAGVETAEVIEASEDESEVQPATVETSGDKRTLSKDTASIPIVSKNPVKPVKKKLGDTMRLDEALQQLLNPKPEVQAEPGEEVEPDMTDLEEDIAAIEDVEDLEIVNQLTEEKKAEEASKERVVPSGMKELIPEPETEEELIEQAVEETSEDVPEDAVTIEAGEAEPEEVLEVEEAEPEEEEILEVEEAEPEEEEILEIDAAESEDLTDESEDLSEVEELISETEVVNDEDDSEGAAVRETMDNKNNEEPILSPEIQKLIDEIEGVIPEEEEVDATVSSEEVLEVEEEPHENMGELADDLRLGEDEYEDYDAYDWDDAEEFDEDDILDDYEESDDDLLDDYEESDDDLPDDYEDADDDLFGEEEGYDDLDAYGYEEDDEDDEVINPRDLFTAEDKILDDDLLGLNSYEEVPNFEDEFSVNPAHSEEPDDREIPDEDDGIDIMSATTPLSRKETAKLIATGKTSPLPLDEIADAMSDTGFIVHGRYDLETQSGIGTRAGLTEEQKKLFSYFVPVRGMSEQLVDVLEQDKNCTNRKGTSRTGNLLIIGNKGNGKTVLAVDVVKAIQKQRDIRQGKVAIVTGESLNKKRIGDIFRKLYGGALIIEKAGQMNEKTLAKLNKAMEQDTGELLVVLEEQRKPLDRLLSSNREFRRKFTSRLEVPIFINDELVTFGQTYAQENGYRIDEMGILALYSKIDSLQREDHAVTVAEVKEVMDDAIAHSQKASAKKLVKRVFGKNTDSSDRILLSEKDFNI
nr:AAA family ATPase [Mediterraneibacter faecis]